MSTPDNRQVQRTTLSLIGLLAMLVPRAAVSQMSTPTWSATFPAGSDAYYASSLDAAARTTEGGLLVYENAEHQLRRVSTTGTETTVSWNPIPTAGARNVRHVTIASTPDSRWRAVILATATQQVGLMASPPFLSVGRYDSQGALSCTYSNVLETAAFGADGALLVAKTSSDVGPELENTLQFFGSNCNLVSLASEPLIDTEDNLAWKIHEG